MIYDEAGNELTYWPLTLNAGDDSNVLVIQMRGQQGGFLFANENTTVSVFGRPHGAGPYVNLYTDPIDLSGYPLTSLTAFDIYLHANSSVGLERLAIDVGPLSGNPANWAG
jgi:hypothetical protein